MLLVSLLTCTGRNRLTHLGDAAGIVAVGLVDLRLEKRLCMTGFYADHR